MVNADLTGLGNSFKDTTTHLMLVDYIEGKRHSSRSGAGVSISSTLAGRDDTGVDLRWYPNDEFKQLSMEQKDELIVWRQSDKNQAYIKAGKDKVKVNWLANKKKRSEKREGGNSNGKRNGSTDGKEINKVKHQKKYQVVVAKAAKKLVASSIEAEKAEYNAVDASLEAAIKRRGTKVSAPSVVSK